MTSKQGTGGDLKLTSTMIAHMLFCCELAEVGGAYYGNKAQFNNRHKKIVDWLKSQEVPQ